MKRLTQTNERHLRRTVLGAGLLLGLMAQHGTAQIQLQPKLRAGDNHQVEIESRTRQLVSVGGIDVKTKIDQAMTIDVEIGGRDRKGLQKISYRPQKLLVTMSVNDQEFAFDSRQKTVDVAEVEPIFVEPRKLFAALAKSNWAVELDADRKVVGFDGKDDVLRSLDGSAAEALADQFDEDYLKQQAQDEFDMLPAEPVRIGQTWTQERELRLEAGQTLRTKLEFKYVGRRTSPSGPVHRVDMKTTEAAFVFSELPDADIKVQDLEILKSNGYLLFDPNMGDIVAMADNLRVKGDLEVTIDMLDLEGTIDLTLESKQTRVK